MCSSDLHRGKRQKKSPHVHRQHADFSYLKPCDAVPLSLYHGELLSARIMAGLLARDSSSGRLPGLSTSGILPFVLAYSGGSAGASHPSSLLSPHGHRDPMSVFKKPECIINTEWLFMSSQICGQRCQCASVITAICCRPYWVWSCSERPRPLIRLYRREYPF